MAAPTRPAADAAPRRDAGTILREVFGFAEFRGLQREIVDHAVAGGSALVLMPTGGGKSLCYQVPALVRPGVGVVVSPLIALMQDQVEAMRQLGIAAAALNSAQAPEDTTATWRALRAGELDLLYVSPERLLAPGFLDRLAEFEIALFAIDEAHCVSQWGHDFRPEYLQLAALAKRFPRVPRLALTATADERTRAEIVARLHLEGGRVFVAGFDRPNIRYLVARKAGAQDQLLDFVRGRRGEAGIVYARSRSRVERFAQALRDARLDAVAYHAGMDKGDRAAAQNRFRREDGVVIVATIAFGMGIDKPDVRFVAHVDLPKSLEAYYQETGRAGRDGLASVAWMVWDDADVAAIARWIGESEAPDAQKRVERAKLQALLAYVDASTCRRQVLLAHFGDDLPHPCGNCDVCLDPVTAVDASEAARKALSAVFRTGDRFGAAHVTDVLLGADTARVRELGHDRLSVHGVGKELDRGQWRALFRQLTAIGLLRLDSGTGGLRLGPDDEVRAVLRGERGVEARLPPQAKRARRARASGEAPAASTSGADSTLFDALRRWRLETARAQGVPPYIIFHDRTLLEIASRRPLDELALAGVPGVGAAKLGRYADAVLAVVRAAARGAGPGG